MPMLPAPLARFGSPVLTAAPRKVKKLHRRCRSNRKVSLDGQEDLTKQCCASIVSTPVSDSVSESASPDSADNLRQDDSAAMHHSSNAKAPAEVQEISASEDSDTDNNSSFPTIPETSPSCDSLMPLELKELAQLAERHQRDKQKQVNTNRRKFDFDWIAERASPALKAHINLKKHLATYKKSPFNAVVQSQWYYDFRAYREQLRNAWNDEQPVVNSSLITPPFQSSNNSKMPIVLQELAHVLEVHDYNFRPGKQGHIAWEWVQHVSSPGLAKHISRKQNDPTVRKSYKKCPTAALVPSTHYAEFRDMRERIWNQLMSQQTPKIASSGSPLLSNESPGQAKLSSPKSFALLKKSSPKAVLKPKAVVDVVVPKVSIAPKKKRKRGPKMTLSGLTLEHRELARLVEEVRQKNKTNRVVFDKDYIHTNASPALSAYIAKRSQLPTFQKNIIRALVSINKKTLWEDFRLKLRCRMEKGMSVDDLMENSAAASVEAVEEMAGETESETESEPEITPAATPSEPRIIDLRHHAKDAYWLAPSQRIEIVASVEKHSPRHLMALNNAAKLKSSGHSQNSKRRRLLESPVKGSRLSAETDWSTEELSAELQSLAKLCQDDDFRLSHSDQVNWTWNKSLPTTDLCPCCSQTQEPFIDEDPDSDVIPARCKFLNQSDNKRVEPCFVPGIENNGLEVIRSLLPGDCSGLSLCMKDLALKMEKSALENLGCIDWDNVSSCVTPYLRELIDDQRSTPGFLENPELFLVPISNMVQFCDIRRKLAIVLGGTQKSPHACLG